MLNLNEIAARIKQPGLCVAQDIDSLKTLCETYPYSQVFPLLYLKTLAQTNDVRLDSELQKFAYRISDRAVLFELLHTAQETTVTASDIISSQEQQEFVPQATIISESELIHVAPVAQDEVEHTVVAPEETIDPAQAEDQEAPLSEETIIADDNISEEELPVIETMSEATPETELPSLPDELLTSLNIGAEMYSLEAEEAKHQQSTEPEEDTLEQERQKLIAALSQTKPLTQKATDTDNYQEQEEVNRSFTSWLKSNASHTEQPEEKPDPKSLIDQFIVKEPKISAPNEKLFENRTDRNELFNPTKKAKESLDESQLPVSETLAKIFAVQGNYPKAIYAYQQLMLIFPEKKVFFATQIEELNKKLNT